jgi:hypothetical protein
MVLGEYAKFDGGEENLGRPESKSSLQNGTGIELRACGVHKLDDLLDKSGYSRGKSTNSTTESLISRASPTNETSRARSP